MSVHPFFGVVLRRLAYVLMAVPLVAAACPDKVNAPMPTIDATPVAEPAPSTVNVSIAVPLATVRALAEQIVPKENSVAPYNLGINGGADNCGEGVSIGYHVARGPIGMSASGNSITTSADLAYSVQARARQHVLVACPLVSASCGVGEPLRTASISITSALAVDQTWKLAATTRANPASAGNRCTVTFLNIDVTDKVLDALNRAMGGATGQLDAEIARAGNLRTRMEQIWATLAEPMQLGPSSWLSMRPLAGGITPLTADGTTLHVGAQLVAKPAVVIGAKPAAAPNQLPAMTAAPGGNAFNLQIPVDAAYSALQSQIDSLFLLKGAGLRYPATGRYYVKPTSIQLYGYGTKAVVRFAFNGSAKGVIYLVGTPSYDAGRNVLTIPDLDFTLETKQLLLKLANWAEGDRLRADLRTRLALNVAKQVAEAKSLGTTALNRRVGPISLSGQVADLQVLGLYVQQDSSRFRLLTNARGTLAITVQ